MACSSELGAACSAASTGLWGVAKGNVTSNRSTSASATGNGLDTAAERGGEVAARCMGDLSTAIVSLLLAVYIACIGRVGTKTTWCQHSWAQVSRPAPSP